MQRKTNNKVSFISFIVLRLKIYYEHYTTFLLPFSFSLSLFLSVCISFSLLEPFTLSLSLSLSVSICLSLPFSLSLSLSLFHSISLSLFINLSICLSLYHHSTISTIQQGTHQTGIQISSSKLTDKLVFPTTETLVVFIGLQPPNST